MISSPFVIPGCSRAIGPSSSSPARIYIYIFKLATFRLQLTRSTA